MFSGVAVDDSGVVFLKAAPPFSPDQIIEFITDVGGGAHPGIALDSPAVLDMRGVSLAELTAADVARYGMRRASMTERPTAGPMAIVCGDMTTFGMLRMFGIVADLSGLRAEEEFCVTTSLPEAVAFIAEKVGTAPEARAALVDRIADLAEAPVFRNNEGASA